MHTSTSLLSGNISEFVVVVCDIFQPNNNFCDSNIIYLFTVIVCRYVPTVFGFRLHKTSSLYANRVMSKVPASTAAAPRGAFPGGFQKVQAADAKTASSRFKSHNVTFAVLL